MKAITSQPDAGKFRSIAVLIVVTILVGVFLKVTHQLTLKVEVVARDRVVADIEYSLAMLLFDLTIKGRIEDLKTFNNENPFVPLAIYRAIPVNYNGVVNKITEEAKKGGWYFEKDAKQAVYLWKDGARSNYVVEYWNARRGEKTVGALRLQEKS